MGMVSVNTIPILDFELSTPPGSPVHGDRYIIGASATGAWSAHDGQDASYDAVGAQWLFRSPQPGEFY